VFAVVAAVCSIALTRFAWPVFAPTPYAPAFGAAAAVTHWGSGGAGLVTIALTAAGAFLAFPTNGAHAWIPQTAVYVLIAVIGNRLISARNRTAAALRQREAELQATLDQVRASGEQLRRAQEMEAVGRLAANIAHNFNNLLTVTMGYIDALEEEPADHQLQRQAFPEMRKAIERGAALTRQLLAFGHKHDARPVRVAMDRAVDGLREMLRRLLRENVALTFDFGWEPATVTIDPHDLEQVVLNLVMNARDALPGGGAIHVSVDRQWIAARDTRLAGGAAPGEYVRLRVRDNGAGLSAEAQSHLFEPFYTTKGRGKGTGLGLAFVNEIARQAGGFVSVTSSARDGTEVAVHLPPAAASEEDAAVAAASPSTTAVAQPATVLLVEDEDSVREMTAWILRHAGHRVLPAASPSEAIALFGMYPQDIDLLITDIVMPQMHGAALAAELLATRRELPVLFVSAYPDARPPRDNAVRPMSFLAKPFSAAKLLAAVADLQRMPA
jgi:signal transduction histidine kinase